MIGKVSTTPYFLLSLYRVGKIGTYSYFKMSFCYLFYLLLRSNHLYSAICSAQVSDVLTGVEGNYCIYTDFYLNMK